MHVSHGHAQKGVAAEILAVVNLLEESLYLWFVGDLETLRLSSLEQPMSFTANLPNEVWPSAVQLLIIFRYCERSNFCRK